MMRGITDTVKTLAYYKRDYVYGDYACWRR